MNKLKSLIYFGIFFLFLLILRFIVIPVAFPTPSLSVDSEIWFSCGLLLILLGVCISEKHFTKSIDVLINTLTIVIVLLTIDGTGFLYYWYAFYFSIGLGSLALISFLLINESKDEDLISQRLARFLNKICTLLGNAKFLFSIIFILAFVSYFAKFLQQESSSDYQKQSAFLLIVFWGLVILLEPIDKFLITPVIDLFKRRNNFDMIGRIVKRSSPNYVYSEQFSGNMDVNFGEIFVIDQYHLDRNKNEHSIVMITEIFNSEDKMYLELFVLVDRITNVSKEIFVFRGNKILDEKITELLKNNKLFTNKELIIGKINKGSNIDMLKIKMIPGIDQKKMLEEGDLLSVDVYDQSVKYQIINVETNEENIDLRNKSGYKLISAQQIGFWKEDEKKFHSVNWVPNPNSLVLSAEMIDNKNYDLEDHCFKVGVVPKSNYPIYIDLKEAINHHIAILGRTGSGKSRMAANLIDQAEKSGYKIVILELDQTNDQSLSNYIKKINPNIISEEKIEWTHNSNRPEGEKWDCQINFDATDRKNAFIIDWEKEIKDKTAGPVLATEGAIAVIEKVLEYHLKNPDKKVCIVMEEAYDFIPENIFGKQNFGQPAVSRISQLVLKCRKHDIGFLIITQRTALVTKTILYSCNTIIALQSFDETSKNFMSTYIDSSYLDAMSILPRFRAIVVGKGSSCDKPVIVDFEDKNLKNIQNNK